MEDVDICKNIKNIQSRIDAACLKAGREPSDVLLIAVSKTKPVELIEQAARCGHLHFGENKVQELTGKMPHFGPELKWHMIGTLQTNKIKYLTDRVDWIHSIPKIKALKELEKRASQSQRVIDTLIQVNISDEEQKSGCEPDDLKKLLEYAQSLQWVRVNGLMGIASLEEDPEDVRPQFRFLRELRDQHKDMENEQVRLHHLSMGMTHDFEVAIEEGATMIRIGTAIFGKRNYTADNS